VAKGDTRRRHENCDGFTLVEMVAALAIAAVVIVATAALLHNLALNFDRGTSRVAGGERLALAAQRLATDIGSAAFVLQKTQGAPVLAFAGTAAKIVFISAVGEAVGSLQYEPQLAGQHVVSLTIDTAGSTTQIIRRRGVWPGPRTPFTEVPLKDDVVLLEGKFDAAFAFARPASDGKLEWVDVWTGEQALPRLIRLSARDRASGGDLFGGTEFTVRADAPLSCAVADATIECLSGTESESAQKPNAPQQGSPQQASSQQTSGNSQ
jgi:prepilin-type N-terminal cleavage/methylation domain-containing protein